MFGADAAPSPPVYLPPPPPGYAGPTAPDYAQPYEKPQAPMEVSAPIGFLGGLGYLSYQFGGPAIVSILAGLACIALPFAANRYFIVLPITGILSGARAIQGGRAIGGIVGITVSVLGGVISLIASGILGG